VEFGVDSHGFDLQPAVHGDLGDQVVLFDLAHDLLYLVFGVRTDLGLQGLGPLLVRLLLVYVHKLCDPLVSYILSNYLR